MKQHKVLLLVAGASPNYQWLLGMCPCLEETSLRRISCQVNSWILRSTPDVPQASENPSQCWVQEAEQIVWAASAVHEIPDFFAGFEPNMAAENAESWTSL
jgi:hypothetical protein